MLSVSIPSALSSASSVLTIFKGNGVQCKLWLVWSKLWLTKYKSCVVVLQVNKDVSGHSNIARRTSQDGKSSED